MRPRLAFVRRGSDRAGVEERRVGDDAIGQSVHQPGAPAFGRVERVEPQDAHALGKPIARRVAFGQLRQLGIDFDKID